jgi:hypothetical protein
LDKGGEGVWLEIRLQSLGSAVSPGAGATQLTLKGSTLMTLRIEGAYITWSQISFILDLNLAKNIVSVPI